MAGALQRTVNGFVEKIGEQKDDGTAFDHVIQKLKGGRNVRAVFTGLKRQHFLD